MTYQISSARFRVKALISMKETLFHRACEGPWDGSWRQGSQPRRGKRLPDGNDSNGSYLVSPYFLYFPSQCHLVPLNLSLCILTIMLGIRICSSLPNRLQCCGNLMSRFYEKIESNLQMWYLLTSQLTVQKMILRVRVKEEFSILY